MSGHANFILPNGTCLGVNDSSKVLGFVGLSLVATLSWEIHTTAELQQGKKKCHRFCTHCVPMFTLAKKGHLSWSLQDCLVSSVSLIDS